MKTREENDRQALLSGNCSRINNTSILNEVGLPEFAPILIIVPPSVADNWAVSTYDRLPLTSPLFCVVSIFSSIFALLYHDRVNLQLGAISM